MDSDSSESFYDVQTRDDYFTVENKINNIRDSIKRYSTNPLNLLIENKIKEQIGEENNKEKEDSNEDEILNQNDIEDLRNSLSSELINEDDDDEDDNNDDNDVNEDNNNYSGSNDNEESENSYNFKEETKKETDNNLLNPNFSVTNKNNEINCNQSVHNTINSTESVEVSLEKIDSDPEKKSISKKGWFFKKPRKKSKSNILPKYNSEEAVYHKNEGESDIFDNYYNIGNGNTMRISMSSDHIKSINSQMFDNVSSINSNDSDKEDDKDRLKIPNGNKDSGRKLSSVSKKILSSKKKHSKYVNVRTKHKTVKEFNSLRFIQELGKLPTNMYPNPNSPDANNNISMTTDSIGFNDNLGEGLKLSSASSFNSKSTPISEMKDIEGPIWALSFSQNGKYLASGGQDMIIRVWILYSEIQDYLSSPETSDTKQNIMKKKKLSPVFRSYPYRYYRGHTSDILDLSWSKTDFLISSSMDKTVRLWHVMHNECLRIFQHEDFVTSIRFHPKDDRYFLSGSLDSKIRLWSIQEEKVVYWNDLSNDQLITSVGFSQDGSFAIAGTFQGDAIFYEFEKLKYNTQIKVCNPKVQKKITGIEPFPRFSSGADSILFTTTDSRIRLFQLDDKSCTKEYKGLTNKSGQIKASFSDDGKYIICGSEDRQVYIWNVEPPQTSRREMVEKLQNIIRGRDAMTINTYETFVASNSAVTATVFAPQRTRIILETANLRESKIDHMSVHNVIKHNRSTKYKIANPADIVKNVAKPEKKRNNAVGMIIVSADFNGRIRVFENVIKPPKREDKRGFTSFNSESNLAALARRKSSADDTHSYNRIFSKNKSNTLSNIPYHPRSQEFPPSYNSGGSSVSSSPYHRRPTRAYSQSSMTNSCMEMDHYNNEFNRSPYIMKSSMSVNMINLNRGNSSTSLNLDNQDSLSFSNDQNSSFSVCQNCNCAHSHQYNCPHNNSATPSIYNENNTNNNVNTNNNNNSNNNNNNLNPNNIVMLPPSSISALSYDSSQQNSQPNTPSQIINNEAEDELKCSECGMNKFKLFKDGKVKCVNCMNEYAMKYSMPAN
eukprot:jgi/Orpsp1_1/1188621/evm.model.d7180000066143.1